MTYFLRKTQLATVHSKTSLRAFLTNYYGHSDQVTAAGASKPTTKKTAATKIPKRDNSKDKKSSDDSKPSSGETRGQCCDQYFRDFLPIFDEKVLRRFGTVVR
jgi:hypothetical protein